jgi:hypothetical protein
MSKWEKINDAEWKYETAFLLARVEYVTQVFGRMNYRWKVFKYPRPTKERWVPIDSGACRLISEAKANAAKVMADLEREP